MDAKITMKKLSDLHTYKNNPRRNDDAVEYVAESIRQFGFKVPIVISKKGVIAAGDTRYKAAKLLGLETVPTIVATDLTDEQLDAFRLADNKVAEIAEWDYDKLEVELEKLEDVFDMEDFGFQIMNSDEEHEQNQLETRERLLDIHNFAKGQFQGTGKYDIPIIQPVYELPEITEWIGFNYVLTDEEPEGKGVHFFLDDYQFERLWNDPQKYVDKLRQYAVVCSPDFSPYQDMPMATQIFNHFRKHWVAAYLQAQGVTVIPTIRASADERSLEWYLDGEPEKSIVIISAMWTNEEEARNYFINKEYGGMMARLNPCHIFVYGGGEDVFDALPGNTERIKSFTQRREETWRKETQAVGVESGQE